MAAPPPEAPRPNATRAPAGDLKSLYASEAPRLARFFRRRTRSAEDVADLVQDAFVRLVRRAAIETIENPAAYLHRIATNLLSDRGQRRARTAPERHAASLDGLDVPVAPTQSDMLETAQLMRAYERAVAALPPRTRQVFLLHRVENRSYRLIADELGIGVRTVEWHMAEALMRIRRALDQE